MAKNRFVPEYEEFIQAMRERKFPYGCRDTKEERLYQSYKKGKNPCINLNGWKLANLYSVNQQDYSIDYQKITKRLFVRGSATDWNDGSDGSVSIRKMSTQLTDIDRAAFTAHFLRLTHPINSFLVPVAQCSTKDLGEDINLSSYVRKYLNEEMGDVLAEFEDLACAKKSKYNLEQTGDHVLNVKYGRKRKFKLRSKIDSSATKNKKSR